MTKQETMRLLLIDVRAYLRNDSMDAVYEKGRREGLFDAIDEVMKPSVEPTAPQQFCVYVQKNVIGLGSFLEYPKNIELVPFGPVFDTADAARLFGAKHGWMDIWWNVQPVNRSDE